MSSTSPISSPATGIVDFMRTTIPLATAMDVQLADYDGDRLRLELPLAPNINDKGCAFGGSLVSAMTLCGWGLVELALRERGEHCEVYVGDSQVRYLAPVWEDFEVEAQLAADADWATFFATLSSRGKARVDVLACVPGTAGKPAATLQARFVAKRPA